ncbi:hypothetical protein Hdeb2414_s0007g00259561 [Helianthus debilis subsp. tardiflorus]
MRTINKVAFFVFVYHEDKCIHELFINTKRNHEDKCIHELFINTKRIGSSITHYLLITYNFQSSFIILSSIISSLVMDFSGNAHHL